MSCCSGFPNCGCRPVVVMPPCPAVCPDTVSYTFLNDNILGIGVLDSVVDTVVSFRGIKAGDYIDISLDNTNHCIVVSFDAAAFAVNLPQATESLKGAAELATQVETDAGVDDLRIVTPLKFHTGVVSLINNNIAFTHRLIHQGSNTIGETTTIDTTDQILEIIASGGPFAGTFTFDTNNGLQIVGQFGVNGQVNLTCGTGDSDSRIDLNTNAILNVNNGATLAVTTGGAFTVNSGASLSLAGTGTVQATGILDFEAGSVVKVSGTSIPANSVFITSGTAGHISSALINTFLSSANTQTGWSVTGTSTNRTITNTSTATDVLNALATLVQDLLAMKVPHA